MFYQNSPIYNPQKVNAEKIYKRGFVKRDKALNIQQSECYGEQKSFFQVDDGTRYPKRIIYFNNNDTRNQLHPTQKPVALLEYLIRTYTNEGDTVLDNCMGSGSTGIACVNTNRNFIGMELDQKYFEIAEKRIYERVSSIGQSKVPEMPV